MQTVQIRDKTVAGKAEVNIAHDVAERQGMVPGADDQLLPLPRLEGAAAFAHTHIVAERSAQENVMPAADVQAGTLTEPCWASMFQRAQ